MINVSESAATKINELLAEEQKLTSGLRVFVQGGGCSGFQYGLMIEDSPGPGDESLESNGVKIFVDPISAQYLERRRSRFRGQRDGRRVHDQEPERQVDVRVRVVVQRLGPARGLTPDVHGHRAHRSGRFPPASGRRETIVQARAHPRGVPQARRPPERRRPGRSDPPRGLADQPGDRLPHAAVDGGRRDRAQGGLRRRPVPLRAFLPAPAALPSHLQDLQPVVRVPELRHRGAHRGSGRRAQLRGPPERAADLRHVRGVPRGPAGAAGADHQRDWSSPATRCASPSPPSAAAWSSTRAPRA